MLRFSGVRLAATDRGLRPLRHRRLAGCAAGAACSCASAGGASTSANRRRAMSNDRGNVMSGQDTLRPRMRSATAAPSASASASRRRLASSVSAFKLVRGGGDLRVGLGAGARHHLGAFGEWRRGASRPSACRSRRARPSSSARTPRRRRGPGWPTARRARAPSAIACSRAFMTRSTGRSSRRSTMTVSSITKKMTQKTDRSGST